MALVHESVRDTHGLFWRPNLLPDDRLGLRLAQLSHPVQYIEALTLKSYESTSASSYISSNFTLLIAYASEPSSLFETM